MKNKILLFATLLFVTFFMSCNNESGTDTAAAKAITADETVVNAKIDAAVDDIAVIAEDQFDVQKSLVGKLRSPRKSMLPACATVTSVLTNDTWTRTIDFGTQGCALPNGNVLKGKIIVSFSRDFTAAIKTITYKLEGFYHNDNLIEGSRTIIQEQKVSDLLATIHPVTTHSIDMKVTYPDGTVYTRIGTRVREMVEGYLTFGAWDDNVFKVWGYQTTTFPNGSKYTCTTDKTTPLLMTMSCRMPFPVSGIVQIEKNDEKATLDYGNGACDNLATMTVNNVSTEIVLKK